ncbi:YkgJ family cysteine cluster protein [Desulfurivibrio sp. D14AmB]|uniref:YkgJ family cysteine cluster protein n=1 Tax=Desulfurivibrio sp. D14AmB TaxID=3374370 RepID=UPI00376EF4F5
MMNQPLPDKKELQAGVDLLARPLLPLVRLLQLLYLTGPFSRVDEVLEQLHEPLETAGILYPEPDRLLAPHRDLLADFEKLKSRAAIATVLDEEGQPLDRFTALESWICHTILSRELETINSLLCAPCGCTLCCTGPAPGLTQEFFEIPLQPEETALFPLPRIDTPASRKSSSASEPPLFHQDREFYRAEPALYHWRQGWSMILPQARRCPQLTAAGGCRIYPSRPRVCRLPQIFSYLLEERLPPAGAGSGASPPVYLARHKLLVIWDCPYVRTLREEIARFAEASGLEPIFRHNKG